MWDPSQGTLTEGRISTIDLFVLTSLDHFLLIDSIFYLCYKQVTLIRRSTVLSLALSLQLVFPAPSFTLKTDTLAYRCLTSSMNKKVLIFWLRFDTTLDITTLGITIKNCDTLHNDTQHIGTLYCYAECHYDEYNLCWVLQISQLCWVSFMLKVANKPIMLSVISLNVFVLNVSNQPIEQHVLHTNAGKQLS